MERLNEIEERLSAISKEVEERSADLSLEEINNFNSEIEALKEEQRTINATIEARDNLLKEVETRGTVIEKFEEPKEKETMEERTFAVDTKEYRTAFLENLMGKPVEERSYATTDSYTAIPTQTSQLMFEKMKKLAPMLSEITLLRASGNVKFVVENARNAAATHTENSTVTAAADTIITVSLGAYEFVKIIEISKNARNMSIDAFEQFLVNMLAGDMARKIDDYIINDTTNGIAKATYTTSTNQVVGSINYANICKLIALMPAAYDSEAKFLMNKATLWNDIMALTTSSGQPIFAKAEEGAGYPGRLLGYPVLVDDYVAKTGSGVYFGRWTDVVGNLSQDIEITSDESAGFYRATIPYRGYAAFDSKPAKMDGICRLVTTTSGI